jgi:hypothetical protein
MIVGADELCYLVHESGAVYAVALVAGRVVAASEALDEGDRMDEGDLPGRAFFSDIGAAVDREYAHGRAALISARFTFDA